LNVRDLMTFEKIFIETKAVEKITKRLSWITN
jgi:ribosomal protein L4